MPHRPPRLQNAPNLVPAPRRDAGERVVTPAQARRSHRPMSGKCTTSLHKKADVQALRMTARPRGNDSFAESLQLNVPAGRFTCVDLLTESPP